MQPAKGKGGNHDGDAGRDGGTLGKRLRAVATVAYYQFFLPEFAGSGYSNIGNEHA